MSIKLTSTIRGVTQEFIHRIERIDAIGKPTANRYVIVNGRMYASDEAKAAGDEISTFCIDLRDASAEAILTASDKDIFAAAYTEMKKTGQFFDGGKDC